MQNGSVVESFRPPDKPTDESKVPTVFLTGMNGFEELDLINKSGIDDPTGQARAGRRAGCPVGSSPALSPCRGARIQTLLGSNRIKNIGDKAKFSRRQ